MKILLAHNIYPIVGGDGVFFHETGRFLEEQGHEVAYYCSHHGEEEGPWHKYFGRHQDYENGSFLKRIINAPNYIYSRYNDK